VYHNLRVICIWLRFLCINLILVSIINEKQESLFSYGFGWWNWTTWSVTEIPRDHINFYISLKWSMCKQLCIKKHVENWMRLRILFLMYHWGKIESGRFWMICHYDNLAWKYLIVRIKLACYYYHPLTSL